jgi:hypothetical protein
MKKIILLSSLLTLISFNVRAEHLCKIEAQEAAYKTYLAQLPNSTIFTKVKFKPMTEGNKIIHIIQILDQDRGSNDFLTITLELNSCKILSID